MRELVGIFGGTFDPVHAGHINLAKAALDQLNLSRVIWSCAGSPALKNTVTDAFHRVEMVRLAIRVCPFFQLDTREIGQKNPSYTIDLLKSFSEEQGNCTYVFLMGMDSLVSLDQWHSWQDLLTISHIGVANRHAFKHWKNVIGGDFKHFIAQRWTTPNRLYEASSGYIVPFELSEYADEPISSSEIRCRLYMQDTTGLHRLLTDDVLAYIQENRIYKN